MSIVYLSSSLPPSLLWLLCSSFIIYPYLHASHQSNASCIHAFIAKSSIHLLISLSITQYLSMSICFSLYLCLCLFLYIISFCPALYLSFYLSSLPQLYFYPSSCIFLQLPFLLFVHSLCISIHSIFIYPSDICFIPISNLYLPSALPPFVIFS